MSLKYIRAGDYGQIIEITFLDVDTAAAADISAYSTTKQMIFTKPDGTAVAKTATFKTTGADGIIRYTVEASFLVPGTWSVLGRVASGTAQLSTESYSFEVN